MNHAVQAVWSACESCMRACLATCRLACDTKQVQRAQRARCRARPPSSPRRCHERSLLCKTKERTVLQRCKLFARDLQRALEATCLQCPLRMRGAYRAILVYDARLRAAYAIFFGKAYAFHGNRLSGGATHPRHYPCHRMLSLATVRACIHRRRRTHTRA